MEWIRGTELEDIRYLNKSTDEEWKIVKNFILCGGCNSLEEKMICYKNILENHDWYETSLVDAASTNDIIAEAVSAFFKFIFLLAVFAAKYPGYQSDLAKIGEITYTYAKISHEETHDLDLAPFKRQECYSRLAKIQLNAYLKIEKMVKMQEDNNEEQISDNKQNHLEQQLKNSIDKKIEEILNTNLDDEKIYKENKDIQTSPQLARVKIRAK